MVIWFHQSAEKWKIIYSLSGEIFYALCDLQVSKSIFWWLRSLKPFTQWNASVNGRFVKRQSCCKIGLCNLRATHQWRVRLIKFPTCAVAIARLPSQPWNSADVQVADVIVNTLWLTQAPRTWGAKNAFGLHHNRCKTYSFLPLSSNRDYKIKTKLLLNTFKI